jgi:hypothetical protein
MTSPGAEDVLTPTAPQDCALVIGLPASREDFLRDVADFPKRGHYASVICRDFATAEAGWEAVGAKIADLANDLVATAREAGARVFPVGDLDAVRQAAAAPGVVAIVGHWRGPGVHSSDLRIDAEAFFRMLETAEDDFAAWVRTALGTDAEGRVLRSASARGRKAELASLLNERVLKKFGAELGHPAETSSDNDIFICRTLAREMLEKAFPSAFEPGNALELRDGFHKADAVRDAFADGWRGIAELAVCNSEYLAMTIKSDRADRRVIFSRQEQYPSKSMRILTEAFLRLPCEPVNYGALRAELQKSYRNHTGNPGEQ